MPATKVLAKVYQLYIVEYQWALILISQSQGIDDITVKAKNTIYNAAQTVLFQINFFPSSMLNDLLSILRESFRILRPSNDHSTIVSTVHTVKNPLFKKPDFHSRTLSVFTSLGSAQV